MNEIQRLSRVKNFDVHKVSILIVIKKRERERLCKNLRMKCNITLRSLKLSVSIEYKHRM